MATTTNYGWETPDDTDLVKDGALAIRTLGSAIDTSLVDLKGGTTGQVLSKTSNTDMDFTWVTQDDANAIQNAIVDAKGDLITATAADTPARLAVGTNGQVLTADSTTATGLKWAAAAGGGKVLQVVSGTTTSGVGTTSNSWVSSGFTVSITPASTSNKVLILAHIPLQFAGGTTVSGSMSLFRGTVSGTNLGDATWGFGGIGQYAEQNINAIAYLDSPSTTSSQTYTFAIRANSGVNTIFCNNGALASMVLLEIQG